MEYSGTDLGGIGAEDALSLTRCMNGPVPNCVQLTLKEPSIIRARSWVSVQHIARYVPVYIYIYHMLQQMSPSSIPRTVKAAFHELNAGSLGLTVKCIQLFTPPHLPSTPNDGQLAFLQKLNLFCCVLQLFPDQRTNHCCS